MLGFESADHPLDAWMERALELCADHGGVAEVRGSGRGDAEGSWRSAFLQAPYLRDTMVAAGVLAETFETAITWDRFEGFVAVGARGHGGGGGRGPGDVPPHARLPRRRGALLHGARSRPAAARSSPSGRR